MSHHLCVLWAQYPIPCVKRKINKNEKKKGKRRSEDVDDYNDRSNKNKNKEDHKGDNKYIGNHKTQPQKTQPIHKREEVDGSPLCGIIVYMLLNLTFL